MCEGSDYPLKIDKKTVHLELRACRQALDHIETLHRVLRRVFPTKDYSSERNKREVLKRERRLRSVLSLPEGYSKKARTATHAQEREGTSVQSAGKSRSSVEQCHPGQQSP